MSPTPESATVLSADDTAKKYKEILKSNGINDEVSEVIVKSAGLQGEGFASISQYVTVKYTNPNLEQLNLFVKAHSANPSHNQFVEDLKVFEKEATFFMQYVPAAKELCKTKGMEGFVDFYPKCYYADEHIVVLENLVLDKGYELVDKGILQNFEEASIALETLAKHHALGNAMLLEHGGSTKFFQKYKDLDYEAFVQPTARGMLEPIMKNGISTVIGLLKKYQVDGGTRALEILNSTLENPFSIIEKMVQYDEKEDSFLLLNHGDYWNNNMMFLKDKETRKVIGHMAIDLQVTRYNSPGLDLGYYFFQSVQAKVRRAHLRELLSSYLEALKKYSKSLGHPIDLSYDELFLELRKKFELGFWFGMCFAAGPGLTILKDINIEEIEDISQWGEIMGDLIQKWIEANPDKAQETAKDAVALMNEYVQLHLIE